MNSSASRSWFARRTVVWILSCGAGSLLVAALLAAAPRVTELDGGGASPYTPTKGEWLCLFLNSRQALMNSETARGGLTVHYLYDKSRPDAIRIKVLFGEGTTQDQVHHYAARAEQHAFEVAKCHGWENWLKTDLDEQKVTDRSAADTLIR